ncbi:hypothetical protein PR003_g23750 [Phytophthora rubi]|uniref:Secreted protein n=1 Tax=Phytophthora rubi TaxID=129364 RepID=A0A6A4CTS4_9STRA|nr:hypothetical protein PR002_g23153 [Phytophthora rubi]KAE8986167.1 hypothetical protein PR001_g22672 [Phytophthora rubi]KAE9296460.1 hypothetical protein PR003_g23750 [Phytophthora rubi]
MVSCIITGWLNWRWWAMCCIVQSGSSGHGGWIRMIPGSGNARWGSRDNGDTWRISCELTIPNSSMTPSKWPSHMCVASWISRL